MKRIIIVVVAASAALLGVTAGIAEAGAWRAAPGVTISGGIARGTMRGARDSGSSTEFIYCRSEVAGNLHEIHCGAKDATGKSLYCSRTFYLDEAPPILAGLQPHSEIEFATDGRSGCFYIRTQHDSRNLAGREIHEFDYGTADVTTVHEAR